MKKEAASVKAVKVIKAKIAGLKIQRRAMAMRKKTVGHGSKANREDKSKSKEGGSKSATSKKSLGERKERYPCPTSQRGRKVKGCKEDDPTKEGTDRGSGPESPGRHEGQGKEAEAKTGNAVTRRPPE